MYALCIYFSHMLIDEKCIPQVCVCVCICLCIFSKICLDCLRARAGFLHEWHVYSISLPTCPPSGYRLQESGLRLIINS